MNSVCVHTVGVTHLFSSNIKRLILNWVWFVELLHLLQKTSQTYLLQSEQFVFNSEPDSTLKIWTSFRKLTTLRWSLLQEEQSELYLRWRGARLHVENVMFSYLTGSVVSNVGAAEVNRWDLQGVFVFSFLFKSKQEELGAGGDVRTSSLGAAQTKESRTENVTWR